MHKITLRFAKELSEKFSLSLDWLKKASLYIVGALVLISVFLLLVGASWVAIQVATRNGYPVVGWAGVIVYWIILLVAAGAVTRKRGASFSDSEDVVNGEIRD